MKKVILSGFLILLCGTTVFASATSSRGSSQVISYTDSFSFLSSYPKYVELYKLINNNGSASQVDAKYEELISSLGNSAQDWTVLLKASLNYAHYCLEIAEKKNSKKAKQLISNAEAIYKALEKAGSSGEPSNLKAMKFCCLSIGYLASPISISKGLESIKIIDNAYEEYPNELSLAILYAARKLNAPSIGGGDLNEAFRVFTSLVEYIESDTGANTADWDKFDIYCSMAKYYEKKNEKTLALEFYYKALDIYEQNNSVITQIGKLEKK